MPTYRPTSAYAHTPINDYYLDLMTNRKVPKGANDRVFTINETYSNRPDLLAYDLYGYADLWWVFAQRNPNVLVNPLLDFKAGTVIFLPDGKELREALGY